MYSATRNKYTKLLVANAKKTPSQLEANAEMPPSATRDECTHTPSGK